MPLSAPIHQLKRRAKHLARDEGIPLHAALDRVAALEGFAAWGLLRARSTGPTRPASGPDLLPQLVPGDLLLLGARPGQGKTRLGLRLLLDAARDGRRAVLFTLEYSGREAADRLRSLGAMDGSGGVEVVASDDVCAGSIARHLAGSPRGTVALVDYLQILDQRRSRPPLAEQVGDLRRLARADGFVLAFIAQIDRTFDPGCASLPDLKDVRLPNPVDMGMFSRACFLHGGAFALHDLA